MSIPIYLLIFLFGPFTGMMLCAMIQSSMAGQTGIESLKNISGQGPAGWKGVEVMMGRPFGIEWFMPTTVRRSDQVSTSALFTKAMRVLSCRTIGRRR
jgi:hypothetical protein